MIRRTLRDFDGMNTVGMISLWLALPLVEWFTYQRFGYVMFPMTLLLTMGGSLLLLAMMGATRPTRAPWAEKGSYRAWLATTPWEFGRPLPLGSPFPSYGNLVLIASLCVIFVLARLSMPWLQASLPTPENLYSSVASDAGKRPLHLPWHVVLWPMFAYAIGYVAGSALVVFANVTARPGLLFPLVLLPLAVFPGPTSFVRVALIVFGMTAGLGLFLVKGLKAFPFDTPEWKRPIRDLYLDASFRAKQLGWPFNVVGPWRERKWTASSARALGLATLAALWIAAANTVFAWIPEGRSADGHVRTTQEIAGVDHEMTILFACTVGFAAAALRLLRYTRGGMGVLSPWARLRTGRLIIPAHDVVYLAPLGALVLPVVLACALDQAHVPNKLILAASVFVAVLIALGAGPSFESWSLTGLNIKRRNNPSQPSLQRSTAR